jgi:hypothetical protein
MLGFGVVTLCDVGAHECVEFYNSLTHISTCR